VVNRPTYASAVAAAFSITLCVTMPPAFANKHVAAAAPVASPTATAQLSEPQLFIRGNAKLYNPDAIVVTRNSVFIVWQGQSDHLPGPSTIVKYDRTGHVVGSIAIEGRCDGLRLNPITKKLWALFNNDGQNGSPKRQPLLYTIDPKTLVAAKYAFPAVQLHGGGYDDIAFVDGQAYLSASSPTLTTPGINDKPIVVSATLTTTGNVQIRSILKGNATVFNANTGTNTPMNFSDPDSLAIDSHNDLVVVGDNDQELVIIKNPGQSGSQIATRYGYGTQFDDVAWTSGIQGTLWIADTTQNAIYTVRAAFPQGTVFGEGPSGIPVQSFIGTIDTGEIITPLLTQRDGVFSPTSLIFVPAYLAEDGI
jgi:hypothetical protein